MSKDPNAPIDGIQVPGPSGPPNENYLTRDIEIDLENATRAWIDRVAQSTGRGRRQAAAFVLGCIRRASRGGVIMGLPRRPEDDEPLPGVDAPDPKEATFEAVMAATPPPTMEIPEHVVVVGTKE